MFSNARGWFAVFLGCAVVMGRSCAQTPEYRAHWADAFHAGYLDRDAVATTLSNVRAGNANVLIPEVYVNKGAQLIYWNPEPASYPSLGAAGTILSNGVPITCDLNSEPETNSASPFDPLAECIRQAHDTSGGKGRVDVWAWLVCFRTAGAIRTDHPEWITVNASDPPADSTDFDAGHPGVEQQFVNNCLDIVRHYDVDGLNFDYIRLTNANDGFNDVSVRRYNAIHNKSGIPSTGDASFKQWRRDQITNVLRKVYLNAIAIKPGIRISADTITWTPSPARPLSTDPSPLATWKTSFESTSAAFRSVLQDWRSWMEEGILDIALPMNYFRECSNQADFDRWADFTKDNQFGRQCVIGSGGYLNALDDTIAQLRRFRSPSPSMGKAASGACNYSYAVPYASTCGGTQQADPEGFAYALANGTAANATPLYPATAPIPELPRLSNGKGHLMGTVTESGAPSPGWIDGGTVTLYAQGNETTPLRLAATDGTGFYGFIDVPPGTYSVKVTARGEQALIKTVAIAPHAVSTLDFALAPLPPATQLAFTAQPGNGSTNWPLSAQPVVAARDASGATAPMYEGPISLAIEPGTGTEGAALIGTTTVNAIDGEARFCGLCVTKPGKGYVLVATSGGLTVARSTPFDISPVPSRLAVATQPVGAPVGHALATAPAFSVQDDLGNVCASYAGTVTVAIKPGTGPLGATLHGDTTASLVSGVATFGGLSVDKIGYGYRLTATCDALSPVDTLAFDITTTAVSLAFTVQPGGAKAGEAFSVQPVVVARNDAGETATDYQGSVALEIKPGTGNSRAALEGETQIPCVNGVAAFSDVTIYEPGAGYVLCAASGSLPTVESSAFNVISATPYSLAEAARAAAIAGGLAMTTEDDRLRLDTDQSGGVDLADALRIARKAAGFEPNP